jgi:hypothetical protein
MASSRSLLGLLSLVLLAGCGSTAPPSPTSVGYAGWPPGTRFELIPVPVSTELTVGENRLLVNLLNAQNESQASPDRAVELRLYDLEASANDPALTVPATYMSTVEGLPGLYRAQVEFGRPGAWGLEVLTAEPEGGQRTGRMVFAVREFTRTPAIGAEAPASETPTATTPDEIAAISTDDDPDPAFYTTSVADALAADEAFVLVFATPAFCRTVTCGPALDIVKDVMTDFEGRLTPIHVEPYQLNEVDGHLQPVLSSDNLPIPVPSVTEWGLPTEPYIIVVDREGRLTAKFEGIAAPEELEAAFAEVAG